MVNEYAPGAHRKSLSVGGLLKKQNIRRFTPKLFNDWNDHNPLVVRAFEKCAGKEFYRKYKAPAGDVKFVMDRVGALGRSEHFFRMT